ncbi:ABC transporter permease [candidate division WWE3 bacterium]|uniref:ABC transporter permease n=1 Tax=candidate division WWE3 bacterium TaxID=2053526 RepID=A0A955EBQ3_UNCKA|nr:ABC transporter permease [candidate division WWE3 bacterium]
MQLQETIITALKALNANKARTFLTMLGVIIGVFAVVSLVSVGIGIESFITDRFNSLGSNLVIVAPGVVDFGDDPAKAFSKNKLDEKHIELIERYASDYVDAATPSIRLGKTAKYKTNAVKASVIGANYKSNKIINYTIEEGRMFNRADQKNNARVVIIGSEVKKELFPNTSSIGKQIKIDNTSFEIIGELEVAGAGDGDRIIMPYTTAKKEFEVKNFSSIATKAKSAEDVAKAMKAVEIALLRDLKEDDFTVLSQADILGSIQNILGILTTAIGAIAGISLLVGGIGIMNIMLVSVTERIKEIGLRKALGATPKDIAIQFLFESVFISVFGGSIGILLGWTASKIASQWISTSVPLYAVLMAFGFSAAVGMIFGTYPALNASKKDSIEALRYE